MRRLDSQEYKNPICKKCIKRQIKKYGSFSVKCQGITVETDVKLAMKNGLTEDEARWIFDPVYFFEKVYGSQVRHYQHRLLYCTSNNITARQCRQTGKTLLVMYRIFQYILTNENKTVLVVAPQEVQLKKIWDEYIFRDFIYKNKDIEQSISGRPTMSPNYQIKFDNGSKIILMIAGPGCRGQTASVIYIDEAAIITKDILSDIMMTVASNADEASVIMTSTPKGRGNPFYDACNDNKEFAEFHTSIYDVEEMKSQIPRFKKLLGETGFIQECEAEFPDASGGPFNYKGIDLSKKEYEYEDQIPDELHNEIYFGGVDWNGPNVGTYFYVIAFNTETYNIRTVDKSVVSSAVWNSTVAKNEFIRLNRKWKPKHWMVDAGFGHGTYEELKLYSVRVEQDRTCVPSHPDAMIKHILEPVNFGGWTEIEDPFTKEIVKKTTKSFIVSQISRLFEPNDGKVPVSISASDHELIKCLENYKLINITSKGVEQYGFDKKGDIEDHPIDSWGLAIYGIVKYYNDLFKRIVAMSVSIDAKSILAPKVDKDNSIHIDHSQSIVLLTDNSPELIYLDERSLKKYEPKDESLLPVVTRTFNKNMQKPRNNAFKRNRHIISRTNF